PALAVMRSAWPSRLTSATATAWGAMSVETFSGGRNSGGGSVFSKTATSAPARAAAGRAGAPAPVTAGGGPRGGGGPGGGVWGGQEGAVAVADEHADSAAAVGGD